MYRKGALLTTKGKPTEKEAKIFVLYEGECGVTKNLQMGIKSPFDKREPVIQDVPIHIAKIGKTIIFLDT